MHLHKGEKDLRIILILINTTLGLYRFRLELLEELIQAGYAVYFSCPDDGFLTELTTTGARYIPTQVDRRGTNPIRDIGLIFQYQRIIRMVRPDIVLTYTIKPNIYGTFISKLNKVPVITTITGLGDAFLLENWMGKIIRFFYAAAMRGTSCIFFQNYENMQVFQDMKISHDSVRNRLVPGSGVNIQRYSPLPYPEDDNIVRFLFLGRLMRSKGITELLLAVAKLRVDYADRFLLLLVGGYDEDIRNEVDAAQAAGNVLALGMQADVMPYVAKCHCVVLPSYSEGMSNSLLEGAAMARPLIASDIPGCREVIDEGINGFLCQPKDSRSLYDTMRHFLFLDNNERRKMGEQSRCKVTAEFDRSMVIHAMLEEIRSSLQSN